LFPVGLDFRGVATKSVCNVIPSSVPLEQVVLAIDSPGSPWSLVLAFITYIVLLMSAALTVPGIFINGDADPRILLRASAVADGDTLGSGNTSTVVGGVVIIAVTGNFLSQARLRLTHTIEWDTLIGGVGITHDVADEPSGTSKPWGVSVDVGTTTVHIQGGSAGLVECSVSIHVLARIADLEAQVVTVLTSNVVVAVAVRGGTARARHNLRLSDVRATCRKNENRLEDGSPKDHDNDADANG
jgi:hypothetical protein